MAEEQKRKVNEKHEAIYARQSVNKLDSISIESQIERCEKEVTCGNVKVYADRGYSGKNTERPEFRRLMSDIAAGDISRVIVYRLDRISRSVLDFAGMIDEFKKHRVDFVSTVEKFDTGTPVGNAMLMLIMIFAQLERETIQLRVTDAYAARSRRGFYMGGRTPYGFRLCETVIDGIHTKMLMPDEATAPVVKNIFDLYAQQQNSLGDVVRELDGLGIKSSSGKPLNRNRVREIIVNPVYVRADGRVYDFFESQGTNIVNPRGDFIGVNGAYLYSGTEEKRKHLNLSGHTLVLAPHGGIVEPETWLKCREKCLGNRSVAKASKAKRSWLAGKLKCGVCGYAVGAKITRLKTKPDKRYYLCTHRLQSLQCSLGALDADAVDAAVFGEMCKKLEEFKTLSGERERRSDPREDELRSELERVEADIKSYLDKIPEASGAAMKYINSRVDALDARKNELARELDELQSARASLRTDSITGYLDKWEQLSMPDRIAVVDLLIESVHVTKEKIEIRWKI